MEKDMNTNLLRSLFVKVSSEFCGEIRTQAGVIAILNGC